MGLLFNRGEQQPRKKHGCLWSIIVGLAIYFGLCVALGFIFEDTFSGSASLSNNTVYRLQLDGTLVEQAQDPNPFAGLMSTMPGQTAQEVVGLDEILSNIRLAKESDKVKGIYLYGGQLSMGQASAKAIRDALLDFKSSGKWIIAYAHSYGQTNYYVASVADRIYLNPTGAVNWNGLSAQKMYYTRVLEKIGVEMQILKVGTFKSAVEPFFRTSMSEADREQTKRYLNGVWTIMKQAVSQSRNIPVETLDQLADRYMGIQPQQSYIECGLVDELVYTEALDSIVAAYVGSTDYKCLNTAEMATVSRDSKSSDNTIAVIYADGEITDDSGDGIVGTKMVKLAKQVAKEKNIKAIVLRVNSPGGSADASEQIWHAMRTLQEKGLPVVVSMGDYAASGGYYISSEADYIFAEPNTLTGSIGIFGTIPNLKQIREKVGLDMDGVTTNAHSDLESNMVYKGMNPSEQAMMQQMIERGYDLFTRRCAEGRHTSQDAIKQIAEGRVWLGEDALQIGLVDSLGNIDDALAKAAQLAEVEDYQISYFPQRKDFFTELMEQMQNNGMTDEERLVMKVREFVSRPRVMAIMPEVTIQ